MKNITIKGMNRILIAAFLCTFTWEAYTVAVGYVLWYRIPGENWQTYQRITIPRDTLPDPLNPQYTTRCTAN